MNSLTTRPADLAPATPVVPPGEQLPIPAAGNVYDVTMMAHDPAKRFLANYRCHEHADDVSAQGFHRLLLPRGGYSDSSGHAESRHSWRAATQYEHSFTFRYGRALPFSFHQSFFWIWPVACIPQLARPLLCTRSSQLAMVDLEEGGIT